MESKFNFNEIYKKEWNDLQFYYEIDDKQKTWKILGSLAGLLNFCKILEAFARANDTQDVSSHIHLGPYSYFKLTIWPEAFIDDHGIYGRVSDFENISFLIKEKLLKSKTQSSFLLDKEYSQHNKYKLLIEIMHDSFIPASADTDLY